MRKFIRGEFELEHNVVDSQKFEEEHDPCFKEVIKWANRMEIALLFGEYEDSKQYTCEYKVVGNTLAYCKGIVSELRHKLKSEFPKIKSVWEGSGDVF